MTTAELKQYEQEAREFCKDNLLEPDKLVVCPSCSVREGRLVVRAQWKLFAEAIATTREAQQ